MVRLHNSSQTTFNLILFSEANSLTKVNDNAPALALENPQPKGNPKKKAARHNRNSLPEEIKKVFIGEFEPTIVHNLASLATVWFPKGSAPNVWLVPTPSMLQVEYDTVIKAATNHTHNVHAGDAIFMCVCHCLIQFLSLC